MKQLLNFEIQIYDIIKTSCTNSTNTPSPACDDLYKTRFIFADGETIFSPAHFCQKLKSHGLQGVSIVRNGDQLALPESAFEFDKICFLETKFKSKQSIWTIKRVWQDTHWYVTYREISGVKKALFYKVCPSSPDIKQCISDLKNAIQSAQKLCDTIGYHGFEEDFQEAHRLLNDTDRLDNVLNGALSACVFAGMGSWDDEVAAICEDKNIPQHQYTEVTNALFSSILNVVCGICSY